MKCDEILKLIRAMKTYNMRTIRVDGIELVREHSELDQPAKGSPEAPTLNELVAKRPEVMQELDEYEQENLLISDPEEYEKRVGNV